MIGKLIASLLVIFVGAASVGIVVPDKARVERAIVINAPKARIYALASDFHNWRAWSPFADATTAVAVTGEGVGQRMRWRDTAAALPSGEQILAGLSPMERVDTVLLYRPMRDGAASLTFTETAAGVRAVWSFETRMREDVPIWRKPFAAYEAVIIRRQIAAAYVAGLENLKRVAEAPDTADVSAL